MGQVELWIGRAGSGKSQQIAQDIAREVEQNPLGGKIFWIVPETVSFAAERRLVQAVHSTVRAEVLSLPRLALRIQSEMQIIAGSPVNKTGQRLMLAQVLKEAEPQLTILHRAKPTLSFLDAILEAFEEMSVHRVSMARIESALQMASTQIEAMDEHQAAHTGRSLLGKLGDLCTLYAFYQRALVKGNLYDPSELMERVHDVLPFSTTVTDATFYIDGFYELQPRELHFALGLAAASAKTTLVISGDEIWFASQASPEGHKSSQFGTHQADVGSPSSYSAGFGLPHEISFQSPTLTALMNGMQHPGDVFSPTSLRMYTEWMQGCQRAGMNPKVITFPSCSNLSASEVAQLADRASGEIDNQKTTPDNQNATPMLEFLERNVISENRGQTVWSPSNRNQSSGQSIRVAAAQNMRAEAEGVAADILSQVYHEHYRFNDMMVVVPNLSEYAALLREVFSRYQIPFDLADPPALATHPLAKFILGALSAVEENLSTHAVLRILKTEFCGLSREDADWLEGYLVRYQISGRQPWGADNGSVEWHYARKASTRIGEDKMAKAEDERANRLKSVLASYLIPFVSSLQKPECTPPQVAEAIWELLEAVRAKRRMASWLVDEGNTEDPQAASVHEQVWQRILGVLNDLSLYRGDEAESEYEEGTVLPLFDVDNLSSATTDGTTMPIRSDLPLPRSFLFESIRTDIASQTLSAVPAGLQSVLVTDIERAFALHLPAVYVLGMNDGALPRRVHGTGILQDEERVQFHSLFGQRLGDTAEDRQLAEQVRVYMALTRATSALTLSYPMAGPDGKELRPSSVVSRVTSLFNPTDLAALWFAEASVRDLESTVWTPATALSWLLSTLRDVRQGSPVPRGTSAIYRWLAMQPEYAPRLDRALRGLFQRAFAPKLSPGDAAGLFGNPMRVNVYQLETYASCPYRHFVQYGLRLAEPAERDATRAERGTLIHAALAAFVLKWREDMQQWREMADDDARLSMREVFQSLLEEPQFAVWSRSKIRTQQAEEALQVALRAAVTLTRHARFSRFVPMHLEVAFGTGEEGAYPAYAFALADGTTVEVRGRIDRIDAAEEEGAHRFRIIDYKSRAMDISLFKIYHGLRLQLPVYSAVVKALSGDIFDESSIAGGFFYLPLVRKMETSNLPEDEDKALLRAISRMQARGLWRDDGISIGLMDSRLPDATDSELFPKMYKKDGSITKQAPVLSESDWDTMEAFVLRKVRELATGIRQGEIEIAPYALDRQDIACKTCSFSAICQFDSRWDHSPLRPLQKLSKDAVLSQWADISPKAKTSEGDAE